MASLWRETLPPTIHKALPPLSLILGLGAALYAEKPPALVPALIGSLVLGAVALLVTRRFPGWALLALCPALAWTGYAIAADQLAAHLTNLPPAEAVDRSFKIQARALYHWQTPYGAALKVDRVQILSPKEPGFQLNGPLTLYLPPIDALPARYQSVETWVRLKRSHDPQPFPNPMHRLLDRYRPRFYATVKTVRLMNFTPAPPPKQSQLSPGNQGLLDVFLAGRPSYIWRERLAPFGLGHLLAISGLHCVFVMFAIRLIVFPIRRPVLRALLVTSGLAAFAHWVGWSASVTRAATMLAVWQCLPLFNRHRSWVRVWASLAILLIIADPLMMLNRGFWYSFAASLGIILGLQHQNYGPLDHPWMPKVRYALPILAAQLFVIPINLMFGHTTELTNLFWNLGGILVLAVLGLLLFLNLAALLIPYLIGPANGAEHLLASGMSHIAAWPTSVELVRLPYPMPLIALLLLTLALCLASGFREVRWYAALLLITGLTFFNKPVPADKLVMLDVGQGLSLLYVTADGKGWVFDAGGETPPGTRFDHILRLHGVNQLEAVFVSHLDLDHYGLLRDLDTKTVIYTAQRDLERARNDDILKHFPIKGLLPGHTMQVDTLTLDVHWPPLDLPTPNDNEGSLVMTLRGEGWSLLLTGDAGLWMEGRLKPEPAPGLRMLQIGHHGSKSATGDGFLNRYAPQIALISCGRNNRFGHPHHTVVDRLARRKIHTLATTDSGSVVLVREGNPVIQPKANDSNKASSPAP